jgi:iron complex transport system substrate-binding protein
MRRLIWIFLGILVMTGCNRGTPGESETRRMKTPSQTKYASGFNVIDRGQYKIVEVYDPWQNSKGTTFSYVLATDPGMVPDSLGKLIYIKTPVKRVITLSTTHVSMIHQLGEAQSIKGVSGTRFIYNPEIRGRIAAGEVEDVGYDQGLNYESIVRLEPDVLFMYGVEGSVMATSEKLKELGIPVVFCGDYLESHPLGKAEWIRFFSLFYKLEDQADLFYHGIDSSYSARTDLTKQVREKPLVLNGLPWKNTWYIAGGKSFAAQLIKDAGGHYLWQDNNSVEAVPMDLESVYARAVRAHIWINPGAATSLNELHQFDERFNDLPVLQQGMVFNNNARLNSTGGNDYWESATVRPDLLLSDLIAIFHPELLSDHRFIYYRQLK